MKNDDEQSKEVSIIGRRGGKHQLAAGEVFKTSIFFTLFAFNNETRALAFPRQDVSHRCAAERGLRAGS